MTSPHASVKYVEPNSMTDNLMLSGASSFERTPNLEDYCIALNIEVEVCSRNRSGRDAQSEVLIVSWDNNKDKVSFMGGTKIGGYKYGVDSSGTPTRTSRIDPSGTNKGIYNALTTYYADMYVGDLVDYGTTEMIGIKSVNVDYQKSCVPIITIQFTDVRGLSLFQPTELSRDNSFNGIKGINASNVAQSFFQCFYKMPLPKFTIYIKGFYGEPVSYEMMCDKFDTDFNSETGNFDCTARFIGYSYSFMTDVSLDALICAPYSDYEGEKYWNDKVNSGEFFVYDKYRNHQAMPTLYDVKSNIEAVLASSDDEMEETTLTEEENTHEEEIQTLKTIRDAYKNWYETLFSIVQNKYGKKYCFLFKENGDDGDYYRILILTNEKTSNTTNLSQEYLQYSDAFKGINNNLYTLVENYNSSGYKYKTLPNVSSDFSTYTRQLLFNNCYVNSSTRAVEFGGFNKDCKLPRKEVVSVMFNSGNTDYTLYTIYNDGVEQYKDAFVIDVDYGDIKRRLNALNKDASRNIDEKTKEKAVKQHNQNMLAKMNWYPTVENFTRIMLAHLETLMMMLYRVSDEIQGRKAASLGITLEELPDVNQDGKPDDIDIPPFPRVSQVIKGDDGIEKVEDRWVGDLVNGEGFKEVDIINGIFNAVEELARLEKQDKEVLGSIERNKNEEILVIKHPLTPFDFFIKKSPYGTNSDIVNNPNAFAAKVAMRMYDILALNWFNSQYSSWKSNNSEFVKTLAEAEAINFHNNVKLTNRKLLELLSGSDNTAAINPQKIISLITTNESIDNGEIPWGNDTKLFNNKLELDGYKTTDGVVIYPIQDFSFSNLKETYEYFNKSSNSVQIENQNIVLSNLDVNKVFTKLINSRNESVFNSVYIEDDFKKVKELLDSSMSSNENAYKAIYEVLEKDSMFNGEEYGKFILTDERTAFNKKVGIVIPPNKTAKYNGETLNLYLQNENKENVYYSINESDLSGYASEAENGNLASYTLSEVFGYKYENGQYSIDYSNSFFGNDNGKINDIHGWRNGTMNYREVQMAFFVMLLDCIDHSATFETLSSKKRAFNYMPKLAVLQIGAMLSTLVYSSININGNITEASIKRCLPISSRTNIDKLFTYLNNLSPMAKVAYIKYFIKWARNNYSNVMKLNSTAKGTSGNDVYLQCAATFTNGNNVRRLFNEGNEIVQSITNGLMSPILIVNGSMFHCKGYSANNVPSSTAEVYLNYFIEKLKELYKIGYTEDEEGNVTRITETPKSTNKDMKKELYRYLKLLYDKWVPSNSRDYWKYTNFFDYENKDDERGHLFHFIDSYYNKIGDKLLINPLKLAEKLRAAFDDNHGDVSIMMLGFMADIYAQNKCMLLSLQNFMDLSNQTEMDNMFKLVSFNEMKKPNKHPDFVVVYPYEPSKHLNVDNAEYNNDGFMLNDEYETPLAVKSRGENDGRFYNIPAFGVTYGKQYQSYFKKVNVNMKSPIATQQSILAKHAILRNAHSGKHNGVVGQDLYDVYTTQSYTCTVEMMGCAWVQPLMYFVLLNIPMFRGSYMILRVNHKIVPGDMVTTFTGTRMGNVATSLVQDLFVDESDIFGSGQQYETSTREANANVDNDCQYKVYPLVDDEDTFDVTADEEKKAKDLMKLLKDAMVGVEEDKKNIVAAGIVGNMYKESKLNPNAINENDSGAVAAGLVQWNDNYYTLHCMLSGNFSGYGHDSQSMYGGKYKGKDSANGVKTIIETSGKSASYQCDFLIKSMRDNHYNDFKRVWSSLLAQGNARNAARIFCELYEKPNEASADYATREGKAEAYYKLLTNSQEQTNADDKKLNKSDVRLMFYNALSKSCQSTKAVKSSIMYELDKLSISNKKIIAITQSNNNDSLGVVFDIILNGYYDYIQTLWWSYPNDLGDSPTAIYVEPSMNVKPNERRVYICKGNTLNDNTGKLTVSANEILLRALAKKYGNGNYVNEVPQLGSGDNYKTILDGFKPLDCGSVIGNGSNAIASAVNPLTKGSIIKSNDKAKYKDWNVYKAVDHLVKNAQRTSHHACASYVENAIQAGGISRPYTSEVTRGAVEATRLRYQEILLKHGFIQIYSGNIAPYSTPNGNFQAGDIAIIGKGDPYPKHYHACMFSGEKWISDFVQNNMSPYGTEYPYAVFRYQNNPISNG